MFRHGVTSEEHSAEFIVQPFNQQYTPMLASDPKVYRIAQRVSERVVRARMTHVLKAKDLYAEFTDTDNPKLRYVMGTVCRYRQTSILLCTCGICKELRESLDMSKFVICESDPYHYVWIRGYDIREPHVLNSYTTHHLDGVEAWKDWYIRSEDGGWRQMDNMSPKSTNDGYATSYGLVTIHDCTATTDPFHVANNSNIIPGPFG